jgi:sugar (pentulose or hexulose) kinase
VTPVASVVSSPAPEDAISSTVLAIDVGSTSVKAALVDPTGIATVAAAPQTTREPEVGAREHDPSETWQAVLSAVEAALHEQHAAGVEAIAVAGPRGSFGLVGRDGRAVTPTYTWQDTRAADVADDLAERLGDDVRRRTGTRLDASVVAPKLAWLERRSPHILDGPVVAATPQGLVLTELGAGEPVVDLPTAAHFGTLDVATLAWDVDLTAAMGLRLDVLPAPVRAGTIVGSLSGTLAERLGLLAGLPLVAAGSDGVCAELGAGVLEQGSLYGYLGTAATVAGPLREVRAVADPGLIVMPGSRHDRWRLLGLASAGASVLDWFRSISGDWDAVVIDDLVGASPPGAHGVLCLPTLAGATAPRPSGFARGLFAGLSFSSSRADLARSVIEGVATQIRAMLQAFSPEIGDPVELRLTGGAMRSRAWAQIVADVTGLPVARVRDPDSGMRGIGAYGLTALGYHDDVLDAARALQADSEPIEPDRSLSGLYDELAETYNAMRMMLADNRMDEALFRRAT